MSVRLFIEPERLVDGDVEITGPDHHYLFRVRRMTVGASVTLFDGRGREAAAEVVSIDADTARLHVVATREARSAKGCSISIGLALIKGDRMEWCIQKLVELGADRIVPIQAARAVVKLSGDRAESRRQRWTAVARDAARQSRRTTVPEIAGVCSLSEAIVELGDARLKAVLWARERSCSLRSLAEGTRAATAAVLIGPEGGWTSEEVDEAIAAGFEPAGLGPRTLRSETAAIAAATTLGLSLGDLG